MNRPTTRQSRTTGQATEESIWSTLSPLLVRTKRLPEALDKLQRAAALRPQEPRFTYVHGVALHSTGAVDRGLQVLARGHERHPTDLDILGAPVDRPHVLETTALGAAWLAGMASGIYPDADGFAARWGCERRFQPSSDRDRFERLYAGWRDAVARTLSTTSTD